MITDVEDAAGTTITSASPGDTVHIIGTGFGASATPVLVLFGGVKAAIDSISATEVVTDVPEYAVDGNVEILNQGRRSNGYSLTVGRTSMAATTTTLPDSSSLNTGIGPRAYLNRTLVAFTPTVDSSTASSELDAVLALDSTRTAWSQVGLSPRLNLYEVEWTWTTTPTWSDMDSLVTDLRSRSTIDAVDLEYPMQAEGLVLPSDYDFLQDDGFTRGALAQVGYEEARRLFRFSNLASMSASADLVILDTGLRFGGSGWSGHNEFPTASSSSNPGFRLVELNVSTGVWAETAAPGHYTYIGDPGNHGNEVAGVAAAAAQGDPDWADGAARGAANANGILGGFDLFGVDDDGDGSLDVDDPGESIDATVTMLNAWGDATTSSADLQTSSKYLMDALFEVASDSTYDGVPMVLATGISKTGLEKYHLSLQDALEAACHNRIVAVSAGNDNQNVTDLDFGNYLATTMASACPETTLVIGGTDITDASGLRVSDAHPVHPAHGANYGADVNLLAPFVAYFVLTGEVDASGRWVPHYTSFAGTSAGGGLLGGVAALLRATTPAATVSDAQIVRTLITSADDVGAEYTDPSGAGTTRRLNLHRAVEHVLDLAGSAPIQDDAMQAFAVDYADQVLVSQVVDPATGAFSGSATTIDTTAEGCTQPTDVEVHPLGDLVYVLCAGSDMIAAYTADDLTFVGNVSLSGTVSSHAEMAITPDGILRVATLTSAGDAQLESFDTWSGSMHLAPEALWSGGMAATYGAASTHDGTALAVTSSAGSLTSEDYDIISQVEPDPRGKTASAIIQEDFGSILDTYLVRDIAWPADDSSVMGVFYTSTSGGSDVEFTDTTFSGGTASTSPYTVDTCDDLLSIDVASDGLAYLACTGTYNRFEVIDTSSLSGSSVTPAAVLYTASSSGGSSSYEPTFVDVDPAGRFALMGVRGSLASHVYSVDHADVAAGAASSGSLYTTDYDAMGYIFDKPYGSAVTPPLSVASPRPNTLIDGVRTIEVVIRDPDVVQLEVFVDLSSACVDTDTLDGISDACTLDVHAWGSGDHVVKVEATTSAGDIYSVATPYAVP